MANYNLETETTVHVKGMAVGDSSEMGGGSPLNAFHMKIGERSELYWNDLLEELFIVSTEESVLETKSYTIKYQCLMVSGDGSAVYFPSPNYGFKRVAFGPDAPSNMTGPIDINEFIGGQLFLYTKMFMGVLG